jgi:hypothetical protein
LITHMGGCDFTTNPHPLKLRLYCSPGDVIVVALEAQFAAADGICSKIRLSCYLGSKTDTVTVQRSNGLVSKVHHRYP